MDRTHTPNRNCSITHISLLQAKLSQAVTNSPKLIYFRHRGMYNRHGQLSRECQLHQHQRIILLHVSYGILWRWSHVWWYCNVTFWVCWTNSGAPAGRRVAKRSTIAIGRELHASIEIESHATLSNCRHAWRQGSWARASNNEKKDVAQHGGHTPLTPSQNARLSWVYVTVL